MTVRTNSVTVFINDLERVVSRVGTEHIKKVIGDSINNNRTLTVNQVIRYLTTRRNPANRILGNQLRAFYLTNRQAIVSFCRGSNSRTDAVEFNELLTFAATLTVFSTTFVRNTAKVLSKVA